MPVRLLLISICLIAAALAGCNDEVFVEPLPEPEAVTMPPSGGHVTVDLGLKESPLALSVTSADRLDAIVYELDEAGDTTAVLVNAATAVPGGLAIGTSNASLRVMATSRGKIDITLGHCYSSSPTTVYVNIEYRQGVVSIPLHVSAIEPFSVASFSYPGALSTAVDSEREHVYTFRVNNAGPDSVTMIVNPYRYASATVTFIPSRTLPLASPGTPVEVPTPGPAPGFHAGLYGFKVSYAPGTSDVDVTGYMPDPAVRLVTPPFTSRRYHIFIDRRNLMAFYSASLASPSLPETVETDGTVYVLFPTGYLIGYNDDPLQP